MKNPFSKPRDLGLLVFLVAVGLRAVYYLRSEANPLLGYPVLDESYYIEFGMRVANGFWLGEDRVFFMDPLYGYLLGLVFAIFGESLDGVRILQIVLDSLNAVMILFIGTRLWSRTAGFLAGMIYAAYKVSFFYSLLVLKTTFSITLLLAFIIFLLHVAVRRRAGLWFVLGLITALMAYLQANLLAVAPMVILLYWFLEKPKTLRMLGHTACLIGGMGIVFSAGALRNHRVSGEWIFLNTQSGRLLYSCNNPDNLTGRYNVPPFSRPHPEDSEADFHKEAERRIGKPLSTGDVSRFWTEETWKFLTNNPRVIPELLKNKLLGTISDYELPVNHSYETSARISGIDRWPLPTFALVFALGIPGFALGLAKRKEILWLTIPIMTVLITVLLFYTSSRFRMPAVPFLILGAGITLDRFLHWLRKKEMIKPFILIGAFIFLYILSIHAPRPMPTGTEQFYLAKAYWSQGRYDKAKEEAGKGTEGFPDQARFPLLLGIVALSEGQFEEALRHNRRALEIDPLNADALHNLGLTLLMTGKAEEAIAVVERAIGLSPNERYFFTLAKANEGIGKKDLAVSLYGEYLRRSKPSDPYRREAEKSIGMLRNLKADS
jgi:tetratricopeptide (TPR) repeat protein